jgi:hypothetical protein
MLLDKQACRIREKKKIGDRRRRYNAICSN